MPRTYQKKRSPAQYDISDLKRAVHDVVKKKMTFRQAEEYYRIPKTVIFNRIKGRNTPLEKIGSGRTSVIPKEIEDEIVRCLITRSEMCIPCDKKEMRELVGEYIKGSGLKTPFKDNVPGEDWYIGFMKRHPELSLKKPEHLQKLRKDARNPFVVYHFYDKLQKVIEEHNLADKPKFVLNADESGFHHDPSRIRAIGVKGKALSRISGGSGRESTTVLACVSANGSVLPPLIIFKGAAVQARWTSTDGFPGTLYATSKNGWMEEPQFFNWFSNGFIPYVKEVRLKESAPNQSALLVYDGHCSHISVKIVETAMQNNIVLMRLPSHLTDKMQPLDKCVFGPVKTHWEKKLIAYGKTQMGKGCMRLSKRLFSQLIGETWKEAMSPDNIISGFLSTGIFPVDRSKFPENEFPSKALEDYRANLNASDVGAVLNDAVSEIESSEQAYDAERNLPLSSCPNDNNINLTAVSDEVLDEAQIQYPPLLEIEQTMLDENPIEIDASYREEHQSVQGTSITDLFCNTSPSTSPNFPTEPKKPIPRLKQMTYGEVLTTEEVLKRLKDAEEKKQAKKLPKIKKTEARQTKQSSIKKKLSSSSSSDDCEERNIIYDEDSPWNEEFEEDDEYENLDPVNKSSIKKGQFALTQFKGGSRLTSTFKYICVIESCQDIDKIEIILLKSLDTTRKTFALIPSEKKTIPIKEIVGILPNPTMFMMGTRVHYKFTKSVNVKEK